MTNDYAGQEPGEGHRNQGGGGSHDQAGGEEEGTTANLGNEESGEEDSDARGAKWDLKCNKN